jgi:SAM-dependent methyltransferase
MSLFWEDRYRVEGKIWGDTPSRTAVYACELFRRAHVNSVLIPGSGYGRNARFFYEQGVSVTGIEISPEAVRLARQDNPDIQYHLGSVLDMPFGDKVFDGIYCFNVLHLLMKSERVLFLKKCISQLRKGGVIFFVVFSDREPSYGKGLRVEENTFESKPGRPVHYYSDEDLRAEFDGFRILETGITEDPEEHGDEGKHTHLLRYIFAEK